MEIDQLLDKEPFKLKHKEKSAVFLHAMEKALEWHFNNSKLYRKFIENQNFRLNSDYSLEDIPFLPVSIFKEINLITGPRKNIKTVINSSATTSGKPSIISLDEKTSKRQQVALRNIMSDFIGNQRRTFLVMDSKSTVAKGGMSTSSRSSAIRGVAPFAKSMKFVLNEDLELDYHLLNEAVDSIEKDENIGIFGFTWIIYKTYLSVNNNRKYRDIFHKSLSSIKGDKKILHIGGWKKLKDIMVEKPKFNSEISNFFNTQAMNVIDFYGMTEQLGTVYPDCEYGYKHAPLYSEVIIRDVDTLKSLDVGKPGFIQLLTPIPHSYPGISILTEDIGELAGIDSCKCGRYGKYFSFNKRIESAPIKGCGDVL